MAPVLYNSVRQWLVENQEAFLPPICNKMMHGQGQLKVFFVGGPNQRKDFHIEEGEEFFYMLKGDMVLKVMERGQIRDVHIREGQVYLLPGRIPHSPQRYEDTMGLVIERERSPHEMDCLRYFVEEDEPQILFERWFHCDDLGSQLPPIIREFMASEQHRTGKPVAESLTEDPPFKVDSQRHLGEAFTLQDWLDENRQEIARLGKKTLFDRYKSKIEMLGGTTSHEGVDDDHTIETFFWQWEGTSRLSVDGQEPKVLSEKTTALVLAGQRWRLDAQTGMTLSVRLTP